MKLFTLKHDGKKHRMGLVALQPAKQQDASKPDEFHVACGAFKQGQEGQKQAPTGLCLHGDVPVKELVRWARRKGFLKWKLPIRASAKKDPQK